MNVFDAAKDLVTIIQSHGFQALFVGGCVRDQLLAHRLNDIDIATSAPSSEIQKIFPKTIPVGIKFGIIIVVHHSVSFEVATFRQDQDYKDGRHPVGIIQTTIEEDAKRRDFTINGLYYDPNTKQILDFVGGQKDLVSKVIRAIGDPYRRFQEDHLRMIRAARYAAVLDFTIEPQTKKAIKDMAKEILKGVSIERIVQELEKMHAKQSLSKGLKMLYELNLYEPMFHGVYYPHSSFESIFKSLHVMRPTSPLIFFLLVLFHILDAAHLEHLVAHFKLSNEAFKMGQNALSMHQYVHLSNLQKADLLRLDYIDDLQAFQTIYEKDPETFLNQVLKDKSVLDPVMKSLCNKTPIISAQNLIDAGIPKGPQIKMMMQKAMEIWADSPNLLKEQILKKILP